MATGIEPASLNLLLQEQVAGTGICDAHSSIG